MRVCSGAGCLRAVADTVRFCDDCKPTSATVDDIREHTLADGVRYRALYSSPRWQRVRLLALKASPMCSVCNAAISEIVDHVVPAGVVIQQARDSGLFPTDRHAGFFLVSNLQGLCRVCHAAKTLADKTHLGGWPDAIERYSKTKKRTFSF